MLEIKKKEKSTLKQTKANKRWMRVNYDKVYILMNNGLNQDVIKIISRYIGSCGRDNRKVCRVCGKVLSIKKSKFYR